MKEDLFERHRDHGPAYILEQKRERADFMLDRCFAEDRRPVWVRANDAPKRRRK